MQEERREKERQLVERVKQGDQQALEELFRMHRPVFYMVARKVFVRGKLLSRIKEDYEQELKLALYKACFRCAPERSLLSYIDIRSILKRLVRQLLSPVVHSSINEAVIVKPTADGIFFSTKGKKQEGVTFVSLTASSFQERTEMQFDYWSEEQAQEQRRRWEKEKLLMEVRRKLEKLTPRERHVIIKTAFEGKTFKEVAQELNLSTTAISLLYSSAIDKLKRMFQQK